MCHSYASAATWSNETLNIAHGVSAAWEPYVFSSISWDFSWVFILKLLTHSPVICEDKPGYSFTTLIFFFFYHSLSLVSVCPALLFSSQRWQEHAGWVEKRDTGSRKSSFLLFSAPLVSASHVTRGFATVSSTYVWRSALVAWKPHWSPSSSAFFTHWATSKQVCQRND